ncbi:class I SAM-dependent methyltransferase [Azohydromonas caseinilytica]|uniref:Methyltransferase domain-containing protein n=1 Tax=Azohydromonas caseinilytica TaxID=2728836 RepID=A0A848F964_9BURK|nr:class I SAM-dependent methyltransferase [Azohydromonas caseinilytica]NML15356.1 methyltransferase domain-containing protein [Azohydromonas caseinilytica]
MTDAHCTFGEFERAGWDDEATVSGYERHVATVTRQSMEALLDDAGVAAGQRVLDIATGPGHVAAAAARRGAEVLGIDFAAAQVRLARRRHPELRFEQADAQELPLPAGSFDAVVNAFGMCHLPEPERALREALRVLKPGGRLAFAVWDVAERAVVFGAFYAALRSHGEADVGLPPGPNFFLFSDPENSLRALREAGFSHPSVRTVPQVWRLAGVDELISIVEGSTVRAAATWGAQTPPAKQRIRAALAEALAPYRQGEVFDVPVPALLASAVKP